MHLWGKVSLCYIQVWTIVMGEKHLRCHRDKTHMRACTMWLLCGTAESRKGRELQQAPSLPCEGAQERREGTWGNLVTVLLWEFFSVWGTPYGSCMPQEMRLASLLKRPYYWFHQPVKVLFQDNISNLKKKSRLVKTPESKAYFLIISKVL